MRIKRFIAVVLACVLFLGAMPVSAYADYKDAKAGALLVKDGHIENSKGETVQLRGVSSHGMSWFPEFINEKMIKELHDKWGANVVRLAVYSAEYNGYAVCDDSYRKTLRGRVKDAVAWGAKYNMYVIVDWHILSDCDPNTNISYAKSFFKTMSSELSSYDNVIYEICNEPNGGTSWGQIKKYAKVIIPIIRKNDSDAIIVVGTPTWSQEVDKALADPIKGYDNIMYTFHFYASTHKEDLRNRVETAAKAKLPIFVTEFSITEASGNGNIDKDSASKWMKLLDKYNISYCMWSLCNKDEASALIKSSCSKKNGFSRDDLSTTGKWCYDLLRKKAGLSSSSGSSVPKTTITKLSAVKKGFVVSYKKSSKVSGYQIRYSTKSSMHSAKKVTVKSNKTGSKKVTKLKAKTKYYVQVRCYKGSRYSKWSAKKSVKTK